LKFSLILFVVTDHSGKTSQENFITEFLTHCEEYNVELLPNFVVNFHNYYHRHAFIINFYYISITLSGEKWHGPIFKNWTRKV